MRLLKGRRIGRLSQILFPGYSVCGKCHTTWNLVEGHVIPYARFGGMFALCEQCWSEMTPDERLPFYQNTWLQWEADSFKVGRVRNPTEMLVLVQNVLAGL